MTPSIPDATSVSSSGEDSSRRGADLVVTRFVSEDDYEAIADFMLLCFGRWPQMEITCSPADHVRWKMTKRSAIRPEFQAQFLSTPIDEPDRIVSTSIRVGHMVWVRGVERLVNQGGDTAVHPDWRLMGVRDNRREFRNSRGLRAQDFSLSWLAQHPATRKRGLERPETAHRVRVFWIPGSLRRLIAVPRRNRGWRFAARTVLDSLRLRWRRRPPRFAGRIADLEQFDERTDAIWDEAKLEFDVAFVRDQERQNWRYLDPRAGRFEARAAFEGDELLGYLVMKPYSDPAAIVDILVRPGRLDVVDALLADAVTQIKERRPDDNSGDLECWMPEHHPYVAALRGRGFVDCGLEPSLRFHAVQMPEEELEFLHEPDTRLHITQGDSDFV